MEMKTVFSNAMNALSRNYGKTLGFIFMLIFMSFIVNFLFYLVGYISNSLIVTLVVTIIAALITLSLQVGFIKQLVMAYNDERVSVSNIFDFAERYFKPSIGVAFSLFLKTLIPSLVAIIPYGYIISVIWISLIFFKYYFVYNELVHDDAPSSVQIAFMNTENVMYGYKLKLFLLMIVCYGAVALINLFLGILGLILTIFFFAPLMLYIFVGFYEDARTTLNVAQKVSKQDDEKRDVAWYMR